MSTAVRRDGKYMHRPIDAGPAGSTGGVVFGTGLGTG
jgi:hypothetical protein